MTGPDAAARIAIADVIGLYCHAIDRRRWDLMAQCFHDDATYSFGPIDGTWRDFVAMARTMIDPLPMTHHQLGQTILTVESAGFRSETYFTAIHLVPADAAPDAVFAGRGHDYHAVMAGRYVDAFEQRAGRWRIVRRVGLIDSRHDLTPSGEAPPVLGDGDPACALTFG